MGHALAEQKGYMLERYQQMLKSDEDAHVKLNILYTILSFTERRDVALIAFERLLNEPSADVRDLAARGFQIAARSGVITRDDLTTILPPLLKTKDPVVRTSIACAAAQATTEKSLVVVCSKITDELLAGFISDVKEQQSAVTDAELVTLWIEWWTSRIPTHTTRLRVIH